MAGFQEVGVCCIRRPGDRQLLASMFLAEYCRPTFIRLQEISTEFTRASLSP